MPANSGGDVATTLVVLRTGPLSARLLEATDRSKAWRTSTLTSSDRSTASSLDSRRTRRTSRARCVRAQKLIDSNPTRVLDLVMIIKAEDGSVEASELRDADDSQVGELRAAARSRGPARRGGHRGDRLSGAWHCAAAVLVWENSWAAPFGSAVRRSEASCRAMGGDPDPGARRRDRSRPPRCNISMRAPSSKPAAGLPLSRMLRVHGSVTW